MLADFRFALRQLRKAPGFALTAVLTLALGIGATTAIFTLVQQVMLKSLPVAKPSQLWRIGKAIHCCEWTGYTQDPEYSIFSWQLYRYFRAHTPAFADLAAFQAGTTDLGVRRAGSSHAAQARMGEFVSGNFFQTFGVSPWMGRVLTNVDDHPGAVPVAVISYRAWEQNYGGDPSVVGSTFEMDGRSVTVVGVAAPGFYGAMQSSWANPDFWIPLSNEPLLMGSSSMLHHADENWLDIIGRVRPDTDPNALHAQLKVELHQWQISHLADMDAGSRQYLPKQKLYLTPGGAGVAMLRNSYSKDLRLLLIVAGCVLLIACANLANLLLARGLKEQPQISVRSALGASRTRLVRKALAESLAIGLLGGTAGVAVAYAGTALILHFAFQGPNAWVPVKAAPSLPVLLFTLGVALATSLLFGIAPAWMALRVQPIDALRGANRSTQSHGAWARKSLVIAQTAISLVLLSAAALLALSLRNLEYKNFGFQTQDRYIAFIDPAMAGYKTAALEPFYEQLMTRLRGIPGVRAVSAAMYAPMSGNNWNGPIRIEGQPAPPAGNLLYYPAYDRVTPGYFATIGNRILLGRPFTDQDTAATRNVAIVNEAFVKAFFKGQNPLGQHFGRGEDLKHEGDYEIVGVATNARWRNWDMNAPVSPAFYLPEAQSVSFSDFDYQTDEARSHDLPGLIFWAPGNPPGLEEQVRKALADINPNLSLTDFESYRQVVNRQFSEQSLIANMVSLFGLLALVLAAIGLYGVTTYSVEQRTSEIGIRMALGANRGSVISMVLRGAFWQVGIGLLLGVPAALGAGWAMASLLYGVKPWNPATLTLALVLLGSAALAAAIIPARRAASIDPMQALRSE